MQVIDRLDQRRVAPVFALGVLAIAVLYSLTVSDATAARTLEENGPIEATTPYLHFLASALAALWIRRAPALMGFLSVASFVMGARELDWHKALTSEGVFTTKLYASETAPLIEKVLAGGAVLLLLGLLIGLFWRARPHFRNLRRARAPAAISLLVLIIAAPVLKIIDGTPRMLEDVGVFLAEATANRLLSIEEIGELALPMLMILTLLQLAKGARSSAALSQQTWLPI